MWVKFTLLNVTAVGTYCLKMQLPMCFKSYCFLILQQVLHLAAMFYLNVTENSVCSNQCYYNSEIFMLWHAVHIETNKGVIYFPHVQVLTHQSISKIF